jgi:putative ABC transport system permease protein
VKFFRLVWANLKRKKVRTVLTVGSFMVAMFLFGILAAVRIAFSGRIDVEGVNRLAVINRVSLIQPLPISYRDRILQVRGVSGVTFATWFGGVYQDERNFFPQMAVDTDTWLDLYPEYTVNQSEHTAWLGDRQGCLVGRKLADRFDFKVGDRIPILGTIWGGTWEFNVSGIYDGKRQEADTSGMIFQYDYLEERRQFGKGTVGWYVVRLADPDDAVRVVKEIDAAFANSPNETLTQTEQAFAASFVKQMGNIQFLVLTIGSVVFITLLLVTGNTMAIAVRERTGEIAVLKTLGYSDGGLLGLTIAEAVLIAVQGAVLGLALAYVAVPALARALPMLAGLHLPAAWLGVGFLVALLMGALAGLLPAVGAMKLRVADGLRRV